MYAGRGFRTFEIGDVDVVKVGETFHLFHLVLPNHDYIAHAVSRDGLNWERVENALFISDPGAWDDDMLWTMHLSTDPYTEGAWRMFYTGLSMREQGLVQRIGLARSSDLYQWEKDSSGQYPLEISHEHYESRVDEGRQWVSFRDPYLFKDNGKCYLLAAARVDHGPIIRRGCVALAEEVAPDTFEFRPPLFHPIRYDDVEVPTLVKLQERYYLIGSIREDVKVHYWCADAFSGPYYNFYDNVLLPQGNYAARTCVDGERTLVWNFFFKGRTTRGEHMLPPPKELVVNEHGELRLKSFGGFGEKVEAKLELETLMPLKRLFQNPSAHCGSGGVSCWFGTESGFEVFLLQGKFEDFRLSGSLNVEGRGKLGLVLRLNAEGNGYYLSLDLIKGIVQLRAWRATPGRSFEEAFEYEELQAAYTTTTEAPHEFQLLAYGNYLEFCLGGYVLLSLADDHFNAGQVGFYAESAILRVDVLTLERLEPPTTRDYPSVAQQD